VIEVYESQNAHIHLLFILPLAVVCGSFKVKVNENIFNISVYPKTQEYYNKNAILKWGYLVFSDQ